VQTDMPLLVAVGEGGDRARALEVDVERKGAGLVVDKREGRHRRRVARRRRGSRSRDGQRREAAQYEDRDLGHRFSLRLGSPPSLGEVDSESTPGQYLHAMAGAVQISLLGEVEATVDGRRVELGSPQQRALL